MDFQAYPDSELMMIRVADQLASEISKNLSHCDHVSIALPGGSTPGPIFDTLSGADLKWDRVHVLLTDERLVPAHHPRSNERLLRERLLRDRAAAAHFVRLVPEPGQEMEELAERLAPELPLSILVLGMGADMHTASLFPTSPQLEAALALDAPPLMQVDAPEGLEPRITLTAPVLKGAMATHIVITGTQKRAALDAARSLIPERAPVAAVLRDATVHWAPDT